MAGFIYLFSADNGAHKIGQSGDPHRRLKDFRNLPIEIKLVHTITTNDMNWAESTMHDLFAAQRIRGEWFNLDQTDIAYLMSLTSFDNPNYNNPPGIIVQLNLTDSESLFYLAMSHAANQSLEDWIKSKCAYQPPVNKNPKWVCSECNQVNLGGSHCGKCKKLHRDDLPDIAF